MHIYTANNILSEYAKCEQIRIAHKMFDEMSRRDVVWRRILRDHKDGFFCISFSDPFDAENLSVYNENHYELTFLSRVLSTLTAPLWINTLIVVYLILV